MPEVSLVSESEVANLFGSIPFAVAPALHDGADLSHINRAVTGRLDWIPLHLLWSRHRSELDSRQAPDMQSDLGWIVHFALQIFLDDAKDVPLMRTPWFQFQRHRIDPALCHAGESSRLGGESSWIGRRGNEKSCVGFVPSTYPRFLMPGFGLFRQMFRQESSRSKRPDSCQIKHRISLQNKPYECRYKSLEMSITTAALLYHLAYMESHITSRLESYRNRISSGFRG